MKGGQQEYDRLRNTYYYSVESAEGQGDEDEIGRFTFIIPPFPYPEHQGSQRCIFTLTDFYIIGQTDEQRKTQTGEPTVAGGEDISGFYLKIQGIGLRNQDFSTALAGGPQLVGTNIFTIPNTFAQVNVLNAGNTAVTNPDAKALAGAGGLNEARVCSNPVGTNAIFEIFSIDTGVKLTDNANLNTLVKFSIEVVPEEKSCGCM